MTSVNQPLNSERRAIQRPPGIVTTPEKVLLNRHHTHYILVESGVEEFGGEVEFRSELEKFVATERKSWLIFSE